MNAVVIPSIFTAVDKFSKPVRDMEASAMRFSEKASAGIARAERGFRKITPALNETQKQLFSMVSAAAVAGAVIGGVTFSVNSIMEYEKAVSSFRTIVGGSDKEFKPFQQAINDVARDTKKSSIDVAQSFEKIAGLNASFAKTPEQIKAVSSAVITLSKASGDELGPSAESLVGIMNQFGFAANQADRTINVLAAGAGVGAASIVQTSEAFVNFGSVAKGANISLEQSVGLIQTLGKFSVFGAEAGTKLRGSILKLQQAGIGYKSGQFQINDALEEAKAKIDKLKTSKEKDAAVLKMFGAENIATGKILLNNIAQFKEYTAGVTGTNQATEQAAIRSNTLSNKLDELKASWINMLTGSDQASAGLNIAKTAIGYVTTHMSQLVTVGAAVIGGMLAFKGILLVSKAAMVAFNVVLGINSALQGESAFVTYGNTVAYGAYRVATVAGTAATTVATAAQTAFNAAMTANPIGVVIVAVMALVTAVGALIYKWREMNAEIRKNDESAYKKEVGTVATLTKQYEKLGYTKEAALKKAVEQEQANNKKKMLQIDAQIANEKGKGFFERDAAKMEELVRQKRDLRIQAGALESKNLGSFVDPVLAARAQAQEKAAAQAQAGKAPIMGPYGGEIVAAAPFMQPDKKLLNPESAKQEAMLQKMESTNNANAIITIKGDTDKVDVTGDAKFAKVTTGSTIVMKNK